MPLRKCTLEERSCSFFFKPTFTSFMAESKELKSLLKMKEENEKAGLKLNIQKMKLTASSPIIPWLIDGEKVETVTDFIYLGSKNHHGR